ncbi:gibberellin-regulated protein 4-like [Primulina tabacum]|uniref:gibberellin-regulated protein 4-like n=1 Tax=Primulina tabacum TaxID=48773 RepID=UPI003F59ACBD
MAKFVAFLLLAVAVLSLMQKPMTAAASEENVQLNKSRYGTGSLKGFQCPSQCSRRCGRTQYNKPCMFFCQKCCRKCMCVPPGYYGNKAVRPCYNNWKTKEGGPKCP